jgi:hypothetical protein
MNDEKPNLFRRLRRAWRVGVWEWYEDRTWTAHWIESAMAGDKWVAPRIDSDAHLLSLIWRTVDGTAGSLAMPLKRLPCQEPARVRHHLHAVLSNIIQTGQQGDWSDATVWGLGDLLDVLCPIAVAESVVLVIALQKHPDSKAVEYAQEALVKMALPECINPVSQLLREIPTDAEWDIGSACYLARERMGMSSFGKAIVEPLAERMDRIGVAEAAEAAAAAKAEEWFTSKAAWIPKAMLLAHREQAIALFLEAERWRHGYHLLSEVFRQLMHARVALPLESLDALLNPDALDGIDSNLVSLMAIARHPQTMRVIVHMMHLDRRQDAAMALCFLRGVERPEHPITLVDPPRGYELLTPQQKHIYAVSSIFSMIRCDGIDNVFDCDLGDAFHDAIAGLDAIGAPKHAAVFREIAAVFGPAGPFIDFDKRSKEMAAFSPEQKEKLNSLANSVGELGEDLLEKRLLYVANHADQFGGHL